METARKWIFELAQRLELPGDVLAGVPKMEIIGTDLFRMEPHKGLLEYETNQISISSAIGVVCILGRKLHIKQMNCSQITIHGQISEIRLVEGKSE